MVVFGPFLLRCARPREGRGRGTEIRCVPFLVVLAQGRYAQIARGWRNWQTR